MAEDFVTLVEYNTIIKAIKTMAEDINVTFCKNGYLVSKGNDVVVLVVMTGGMIFAGHLIPEIIIDHKVDYCHLSRYGNDEEGTLNVEFEREPSLDLKNKIVLIVDDIFDEGYTLKAVKEYVVAHGGTPFTAVLFNKIRKGKQEVTVDFVGINIPDKFVFGFGLDLQGYKRNYANLYYLQKRD